MHPEVGRPAAAVHVDQHAALLAGLPERVVLR